MSQPEQRAPRRHFVAVYAVYGQGVVNGGGSMTFDIPATMKITTKVYRDLEKLCRTSGTISAPADAVYVVTNLIELEG